MKMSNARKKRKPRITTAGVGTRPATAIGLSWSATREPPVGAGASAAGGEVGGEVGGGGDAGGGGMSDTASQ